MRIQYQLPPVSTLRQNLTVEQPQTITVYKQKGPNQSYLQETAGSSKQRVS